MRHLSFAVSTSVAIGAPAGSVESQYLVGASSPSGHSIMIFRRVDIELEVWRSGRSGVSAARTIAFVRRWIVVPGACAALTLQL